MVWIYCFGVTLVIGSMLGGYFLGPQASEKAAQVPYESGIVSTGSARQRFPVHFYQVALFFVVFDVESIFIYAWSVSIRELGVKGLMQMAVFMGLLLLALLYLFRVGAFDIGPRHRKPGEKS
ncbi:MAG: NADH-quinone oxidoreductase subunit A [Myxococcaceae bacterium]|nr:NADH-quinone oxidoreductase subunit A [Myxococcaceae bacterium]MBH2006417.1 NADH-quinone oxidoreductase subunit A [Myxococcaceae bacterium]